MKENDLGGNEVVCKGLKIVKTNLTGAAKAWGKITEEDTTLKARYWGHGMDT